MNILNEKTLIPLSALIFAGSIIYWAVNVGHIAHANKTDIENIKYRQEFVDDRTNRELRLLLDKTHSIEVRLARIEAMLFDLNEQRSKK